MAYENFKETIWAKGIERALLKRCVLENNCNTKFAGEVGEGKKVKILGAARPTVRTYVPGTNINVAEKPSDTGVTLEIDQFKYANFFVDSIEAAQSDADIMQALVDGAADGITELRDAYVGSLAANATNKTTSSSANTEEKAIALVDAALISLWGIGVRSADDVVVECPPWFYDKICNKLIALSSDNPSLLKNGEVGRYKGAHVVMSNCLYNDGTDDYIMVRTKKAIAFAGGIHRVIPYEPELQFGEAVKVLDTYGAKIVRQDELRVILAHNS
ncbi:MAG: hypothetical protein IJL69_04185 [Oscillospiraceae bacterium]|nr:hypothetical protein [Oscillospiraceae bacterium]